MADHWSVRFFGGPTLDGLDGGGGRCGGAGGCAGGADGGGAGATLELRSHSRPRMGRPVVAIKCRPMIC